jgi:hypothetical protein
VGKLTAVIATQEYKGYTHQQLSHDQLCSLLPFMELVSLPVAAMALSYWGATVGLILDVYHII